MQSHCVPQELLLSRSPGESRRVVHLHLPAFTLFMEAQLASLCNHHQEKLEKERIEVAQSGCGCLFPDPVLQGVSGLPRHSHKPLRHLGQLSKTGPIPLVMCEIPSPCEGRDARYTLPIHPHFNVLFTLPKQEKLITFSKQFQRL